MSVVCHAAWRPLARRLPRDATRRTFATHADPFITILECGARDGLQNEKTFVETKVKAELIRRLASAGLTYIEAGGFIPAKWVPQMADTKELLPLLPHGPGMNFPVLTPNTRALDDIVASGSLKYIKEVFVFGAASEGFSRANTNCTIAESLDRAAATTEKALSLGLRVRGSVSCIVGSPFERGVTDKKLVRDMAQKMIEFGCYAVTLGDTIGIGNPGTIRAVVDETIKSVSASQLAIHCHDTYGGGVANVVAAVEGGIRAVDSSVGGLGGCPYAPGATGNVATEDVVFALHGMGYQTGINLKLLSETGDWITALLGRPNSSRAGTALVASARRERAEARA